MNYLCSGLFGLFAPLPEREQSPANDFKILHKTTIRIVANHMKLRRF